MDMSGNVWEWVADWFDSSYYTYSPSKDPTGPEVGVYKGLRGGAWDEPASDLRTTMRNHADPVVYGPGFGFRCVSLP
jgi:formylglycine-generating enzyme required for sulfatase activity